MAFCGTEIERKDAKQEAAPARPTTPRLECVVDPDPLHTHPPTATNEPPTDSEEIVEKEIFQRSTQGLNLFYMQKLLRCTCMLVLDNKN